MIKQKTKNILITFLLKNDESPSYEASEVNKVARRLKLWVKRPNQLNTKILTAFLKLQASEGRGTEERLRQEVNEAAILIQILRR